MIDEFPHGITLPIVISIDPEFFKWLHDNTRGYQLRGLEDDPHSVEVKFTNEDDQLMCKLRWGGYDPQDDEWWN